MGGGWPPGPAARSRGIISGHQVWACTSMEVEHRENGGGTELYGMRTFQKGRKDSPCQGTGASRDILVSVADLAAGAQSGHGRGKGVRLGAGGGQV